MTNIKLQNILAEYPDECEILIITNGEDFNSPTMVSARYYEDDDYTIPKLIIEI